jgi:hypothetical protein
LTWFNGPSSANGKGGQAATSVGHIEVGQEYIVHDMLTISHLCEEEEEEEQQNYKLLSMQPMRK